MFFIFWSSTLIWIRIHIRTGIELKCRIRIRIETYADPEHYFIVQSLKFLISLVFNLKNLKFFAFRKHRIIQKEA